jgi:hypothetical protein
MKVNRLKVYVDSLLLANHFSGSYAAKGEKLIKYLEVVKGLAKSFVEFTIMQVPREDNAAADALANLASTLKIPEDIRIPITHILFPAIEESNALNVGSKDAKDPSISKGSWITPIKDFLLNGKIPEGENPRAFRAKVTQFLIIDNILYRKSLAGPYLRCIEDPEIEEVLKDIHEGDYGNHTGGQSIILKDPSDRILLAYYEEGCFRILKEV